MASDMKFGAAKQDPQRLTTAIVSGTPA